MQVINILDDMDLTNCSYSPIQLQLFLTLYKRHGHIKFCTLKN